jgi:hypothetical protein
MPSNLEDVYGRAFRRDLGYLRADGIPPFSEDDEQNPPAKVVELKRRIRESGRG